MGDALSQTPYSQAHPCRLPERRLLPTLHKYFLFFNFTIFAREGYLQITCGAWASAHFLFLPLCPPLWGMRSSRRLMRLPIPAVFPSVGSCRLCTNLLLFFNFTVFARGSCPKSNGGARATAHYLFLPPLSPSMGDALFQTPYAQTSPCRLPERRLLPTLAPSSRTCLLCWRPRGLHRATSGNCR